MVYTLAGGAQGYNSRLHYSLYGGVEYFPNYSLAWKELLPLAAVPVATIALLVAIVNFHVPSLSSPGESGAGANSTNKAALSSLTTTKSTGNPQSTSNPTSSGATSVPPRIATTTDNFLLASPVQTSGSGSSLPEPVIGGLGSGGGGGGTLPGTGTTDPVPVSGGSTTVGATTPVVSADATVNTQQPQAGVDVFAPVTGTQVSAGLAL